MKGSAKINHKPYYPPVLDRNRPYICRLAPEETGFSLEWLDPNADSGAHTLFYGPRDGGEKQSVPVRGAVVRVDGLKPRQDYEFYLEDQKGRRSNVRLVRTGAVPDGATVINYLHPDDMQYDFSGRYLCSPSLARLKSGKLIASMDVYGHMAAQNLTILFYSSDQGRTWRYLTDLYPFYWGSLFCHRDVLYLLGLSTEYGNLQITCSRDEGETWAEPVTLFYGSNVLCPYGGVHRAPMHLVPFRGRLYTTCEYGSWETGGHIPAILSIDENADPMVPENWVRSDFLRFEGRWKEEAVTKGDTIEGNIVADPDGRLYNIMRWKEGSMLRLRVDPDNPEAAPVFESIDPAPVATSMFRIIPHGREYLLITNRKTPVSAQYEGDSPYRNVLTIFRTKDLRTFIFDRDVLNYEKEDPMKIGFQYPAFLKDGNSLSLMVRSAFHQADSFHNSNYMLFLRLEL